MVEVLLTNGSASGRTLTSGSRMTEQHRRNVMGPVSRSMNRSPHSGSLELKPDRPVMTNPESNLAKRRPSGVEQRGLPYIHANDHTVALVV